MYNITHPARKKRKSPQVKNQKKKLIAEQWTGANNSTAWGMGRLYLSVISIQRDINKEIFRISETYKSPNSESTKDKQD